MLLHFPAGQAFATGASPYIYQPITDRELFPRILLRIMVGTIKTSAFVDTGGVYFLCSPSVARQAHLYPEDSIDSLRLLFRGFTYFGHLYRIPLTVVAFQGQPLTIDVTAFVPQIEHEDEWPDFFPCILGMSGCLERLRFAIDPTTDTFYFGELI